MPIHWGNIHCMTILDIFKSCKSTFPTMLLYSLTEDHFVLVFFSWLNPNKNMSSFIWCHTNNTGLRLQYNDRDKQVVTLKLGDIWIQVNNYHMRCTNSNNWTKKIPYQWRHFFSHNFKIKYDALPCQRGKYGLSANLESLPSSYILVLLFFLAKTNSLLSLNISSRNEKFITKR
jgi:hypothetical protein